MKNANPEPSVSKIGALPRSSIGSTPNRTELMPIIIIPVNTTQIMRAISTLARSIRSSGVVIIKTCFQRLKSFIESKKTRKGYHVHRSSNPEMNRSGLQKLSPREPLKLSMKPYPERRKRTERLKRPLKLPNSERTPNPKP